MKKRWWILGGLSVLTLGALGWANRRRFTVHDITTGESGTYPELRSRVYYADASAVLSAAEHAMHGLSRWQITNVDTSNHVLDAEARTSFGGLTDDVTVYAQAIGGGQSRAVIRARARTGGGDGGRNATHIGELQDAMDARLTQEAAF